MSFGHVHFTFMGFKGQICIWEGFSFLSPQTSCNGSLFSFPRALSLYPDFGTGHFYFRTKLSHGNMGLLEHKGGWDCTGWGNAHSNSHLSLSKPSPLYIAGICFFSVGFQTWIYMMFFNAERSERIWIFTVEFSFLLNRHVHGFSCLGLRMYMRCWPSG